MPTFIEKPTQIEAAGNKPKIIQEYIGRVNSQTEKTSVAKMKSPQGWVEPGQTPEFDEFTVVLKGCIHVESKEGTLEVNAGQAVITHAGEWVTPGTPVVELVATEALRIDFEVPQEYYPRISPSLDVEVTLDAWPGRSFGATVIARVPKSDTRSRTFTLLTRLVDDAETIPGMSARALLRLDAGREGVAVSRDALLRYPDGA